MEISIMENFHTCGHSLKEIKRERERERESPRKSENIVASLPKILTFFGVTG